MHMIDKIKWIASILAVIAVIFRAINIPELHWVDMLASEIAIIMWLYISFKWKDKALIMLNGVNLLILTIGLIRIVL